MNPSIRSLALATAFFLSSAQAQVMPPPENVVQLSATLTVEVAQDLLRMSLAATRQGPDAAQLQAQLKGSLEQALAEARRTAAPGEMDVRTGDFRLTPQYGRDGKITTWQGTAELVLEGRDFPRIAQAAGRIQALTLSNVSFALSREHRAAAERDAQVQAVASFRGKAAELAKSFGFAGYSLREVAVNAGDSGMPPRPMRMAAAEAKMASDAPVPIEAGKTAVSVTVSGSVQLR
jgi:predicted secreted protein